MLWNTVPEQPSVLLYASLIEGAGVEFFGLACERDLEGIVAKLKHGAYGEHWYKTRNPRYPHYKGRRPRRRHRQRRRPSVKYLVKSSPLPRLADQIRKENGE
jgi:hypothetical protein